MNPTDISVGKALKATKRKELRKERKKEKQKGNKPRRKEGRGGRKRETQAWRGNQSGRQGAASGQLESVRRRAKRYKAWQREESDSGNATPTIALVTECTRSLNVWFPWPRYYAVCDITPYTFDCSFCRPKYYDNFIQGRITHDFCSSLKEAIQSFPAYVLMAFVIPVAKIL